MNASQTELGEVLLSVQCALARDGGLAEITPRMVALSALRPWAPSSPGSRTEPLDPDTGAGTARSLHRDVNLKLGGRSAAIPSFVLTELTVSPDDPEAGFEPDALFTVMKLLLEMSPFVLRARDRMYRTGPNQVIALLDGAGAGAADAVRSRLEAALQRSTTGRGGPVPRLTARPVDPASMLEVPGPPNQVFAAR